MTIRSLPLLFSLLIASISLQTAAADVQPAAAAKAPQWIVVTAPAFRDELTPLCDYRRAEGLDVVVVKTTDILTAEQLRRGEAAPLVAHIQKLCRAAKDQRPSYVLLVGGVRAAKPEDAERTVVPTIPGTVGRMKDQPSDNAYGDPDKLLAPAVAVGRFPARSADDVRAMVRKTLAFERDGRAATGAWRDRLTLIAGNPGGDSAMQRRFAEFFVQSIASTRFDRIHPRWTGRCIIHAPQSPFCVPDDRLRDVCGTYLEEGQLFSFYLGHSSAGGLWSAGAPSLRREDFAAMKSPHGPGVLFTCGCFGCQLEGADGEGYGLAAMRNPAGPVAVMGAHGESYAAMGQLAADGMLDCLSRPEPPARLADYWLAVRGGIARGPMDPLTFMLYDQADGSQGKTSLAVQRKEHAEMWMLLGDPAMRLPIRPATITLKASADAIEPGKEITITGTLPAELANATVTLTLERPAGSVPTGLEPLPADASKAGDVMLANHKRANDCVLSTIEVRPRDGRFEHTLKLPADAPWPRLTVRAVAATDAETGVGVLVLPANSLPEGQPR